MLATAKNSGLPLDCAAEISLSSADTEWKSRLMWLGSNFQATEWAEWVVYVNVFLRAHNNSESGVLALRVSLQIVRLFGFAGKTIPGSDLEGQRAWGPRSVPSASIRGSLIACFVPLSSSRSSFARLATVLPGRRCANVGRWGAIPFACRAGGDGVPGGYWAFCVRFWRLYEACSRPDCRPQ